MILCTCDDVICATIYLSAFSDSCCLMLFSECLQLTFVLLVLPCLLLGYLGQAAYLVSNHNGAEHVFFNSVPSKAIKMI